MKEKLLLFFCILELVVIIILALVIWRLAKTRENYEETGTSGYGNAPVLSIYPEDKPKLY